EVMGKMGYPRGLIRYATQNGIDGKPSRVLRPRILIYGLVLLGLCVAWAWGVTHRSELIVEVLRDRNALYRQSGDGSVANDCTLKVVNKSQQGQRERIILERDVTPRRAGVGEGDAGLEHVVRVAVSVVADDGIPDGRHDLRFVVESIDGSERRV